MGSTTAIGLREAAPNIDTALFYHLRSNHYPPVPSSMVGPCKRAIANANAGDWDKLVRLPAGITWRGKRSAPTYSIVEAHHLDWFLDQ